MKRLQWFRLYNDTLNDPKVRRLDNAERFGIFCGLLTLAGGSPVRGTVCIDENTPYTVKELAQICMTSAKKMKETMQILENFNIISQKNDGKSGFLFNNWNERQYDKPSDFPEFTRERQRKSRDCHADVTPQSRPSHAHIQSRVYTETENNPPKSPKGDGMEELSLDIEVPEELSYPLPGNFDYHSPPDDFRLFTQAYPKPTNNAATYTRWYQIVEKYTGKRKVSPGELARCSERYNSEVGGTSPKLIKAGEVFLSAEGRHYEKYKDDVWEAPQANVQQANARYTPPSRDDNLPPITNPYVEDAKRAEKLRLLKEINAEGK